MVAGEIYPIRGFLTLDVVMDLLLACNLAKESQMLFNGL